VQQIDQYLLLIGVNPSDVDPDVLRLMRESAAHPDDDTDDDPGSTR
jgi:hypothetical protein